MERTRRSLGDDPAEMEPERLTVYGSLHLRSAVLAARGGDADLADVHLAAAARAADLLPNPAANHYGMEFNSGNVALHAAAVEIEGGPKAIERALPLYEAFPSGLPPVRAGHFWIEVARAWYFLGDRRRAFEALRRARRAAPQQVRIRWCGICFRRSRARRPGPVRTSARSPHGSAWSDLLPDAGSGAAPLGREPRVGRLDRDDGRGRL